MNTQPRKQRAGYLSVGWLTDKKLIADLRAYKADAEARGGVPVPMSHCVRVALRAGLDALLKGR